MKLILTTATTLLLAAAMVAQTPGPRGRRGGGPDGERPERGDRGPRIEQLTEYLSLTEDQVAAVGTILTERRTAARENMQAIAEKRRAAMEELKGDNPNAPLVGQLLVEAKQMQGAVKANEAEYIARIQGVLDSTQQARLERLSSMVEYQREIREAQGIGLLPNEAGDVGLGIGRRGFGGKRGGPAGRRGGPRGGAGGPPAGAFTR